MIGQEKKDLSILDKHFGEVPQEKDELSILDKHFITPEPVPSKSILPDWLTGIWKGIKGGAEDVYKYAPEILKETFTIKRPPPPEEPPPREIPTMRAMEPVEKEFYEKHALSAKYQAATEPEKKQFILKQGGMWSKDPKVNYWSEKLAEHLPWWLTGFAAPGFVVTYEALQQIPNIAMSIVEKSKYDPLARRYLGELLSEETPRWLKVAAFLGEEGTRLVASGLAAGKISEAVRGKGVDWFLERAEKLGYPKDYLDDVRMAINKYGNREGLRREIERMVEMSRTEIPSPLTRRIGEAATYARPKEVVHGKLPAVTTAATRIAKPKGLVYEPTTSEIDRIRMRFREEEGVPAEKIAETLTINVKPNPDGSVDVTVPKPQVPIPEEPGKFDLESLWAAFEKHPKVLYKEFADFPDIEPAEAVKFFEARGKEVIGKPEVKPVKPRKAPKYKDPILQAISEHGRVKPNVDYPSRELQKVLPRPLIAKADDPIAKPMDEMADELKALFPGIEGDIDLWDMLAERKAGKPLTKEESAEAERERALKEYESYKEEEEPLGESFGIPRDIEPSIRGYTRGKTLKELESLKEGRSPEELKVLDKIIEERKAEVRAEKYVTEKGEELGRFIRKRPIPPKVEAMKDEYAEWLKDYYKRRGKPEQLRLFAEEEPAKRKALFKSHPELRQIERDLKAGKEITAEQKAFLKELGMYEYAPPREPKPLPEPTPEKLYGERLKLSRVSLESPTGVIHSLGELPAEMVGTITEYARKLGLETKVKASKSFKGRWGDYLKPKDIEEYMRGMLRDAKEKPVEKWREWEGELDDEYKKLYAGLPAPEMLRDPARKLLSKLQIEPQFKEIGAPDTGLQLKLYHPTRNAELERGEKYVKKLNKIAKDFGFKDEDFQELARLASEPGRFFPKTPEQRRKFSLKEEEDTPYKIVRRFFKEYEKRLINLGVIEEGFPKSYLNRLQEEKIHVLAALKKIKKIGVRRKKLSKRLEDIESTIEKIKSKKIQYVHIPRMWFELIWDRNPRTAPRIITEFFAQRKTVEFSKLADYLMNTKVRDLIPKDEWEYYKAKDLDKVLLKPEDLDIRRIMFAYAHKVGHKIALAKIFNAAKKEKLMKDIDVAPKDWQTLPSWIYPTLKGKAVHPVFKDFFESNFVRQGFMPPKLGGVLGTIKLMQFYNPFFLPMYDVKQAFWAGSLLRTLPWKMFKNMYKASKSMLKGDKHYWNFLEDGGASTPYTPSFDMYLKRAEKLVENNRFFKNLVKGKYINPYNLYKISWKTAWELDHWIRLMTYHNYLEKGFTSIKAAQTTAIIHCDYASVPPKTRKWMNKLFFTPSFKIGMMSAQAQMFNNAGKMFTKARKTMGDKEKALAKALIGLATGIALREAAMNLLGFKRDQFGLKYSKEIETEEGKKELVLHTATPDNVILRFWHRFKIALPFGKEEKTVGDIVNRAKWELHPLWQLAMELFSNQSVSFKPIYRDDPQTVKLKDSWRLGVDGVHYAVRRLARITELLPSSHPGLDRRDAYNALVKDLGKTGVVLSWFTLPYTRNTKEERLVYQINRLKRRFKFMMEENKPRSEKEAERRRKAFIDYLTKLRTELEKIRDE